MTEYHLNEFAVASEFPLPHDEQTRSSYPPVDCLTLRRASLADVPSTLRKIRRQLVYDVGDGFLIEPETIHGSLALHIDFKGRNFTVDCDDEKLPIAAAWAVHTGLGAATITHGGVPLHGAGLEIGGKYVALMADSGSGKSTLSWFLMGRGALFGNDDLIPVYAKEDQAIAFPSVSLYPKLQREAVDRHGLDPSTLPVADYGTGEEEYYVPLPVGKRVLSPAPLAAVVMLKPHLLSGQGLRRVPRMPELVTARRLPEDEAATMLGGNLHALWLIGKWVDRRRIGTLCRSLAARVPVYELTYPKAFAVLPTLADTLCRIIE